MYIKGKIMKIERNELEWKKKKRKGIFSEI